jgi:hypothetical protein
MVIESCRDCANLEDRRDIEGLAMCAMNHGPSVCCPEFKPRNKKTYANKLYDRFCLKCANFENIDSIPICAKDHRPGIACGAFRVKKSDRTRRKFSEVSLSITV